MPFAPLSSPPPSSAMSPSLALTNHNNNGDDDDDLPMLLQRPYWNNNKRPPRVVVLPNLPEPESNPRAWLDYFEALGVGKGHIKGGKSRPSTHKGGGQQRQRQQDPLPSSSLSSPSSPQCSELGSEAPVASRTADDNNINNANTNAAIAAESLERLRRHLTHRRPLKALRAFERLVEVTTEDEDDATATTTTTKTTTTTATVNGAGANGPAVRVVVSPDDVRRLFALVTARNGPPFAAYKILQYYRKEHGTSQQQQRQRRRQQHQSSISHLNDQEELVDGVDSDLAERSHQHNNNDDDIDTVDPGTVDEDHETKGEMDPILVDWYASIAFNVRYLDPTKHHNGDIQTLVRGMVVDVTRDLTTEAKLRVYPLLIASLAMQRAVRVGSFARLLYNEYHQLVLQREKQKKEEEEDRNDDERKTDPELGMEPSESIPKPERTPQYLPASEAPFLEHLLGQARYQRYDDLPYPEILASLVRHRRPYPVHALATLEHLSPFDTVDRRAGTKIALRALLDLQEQQPRLPNNDTKSDRAGDAVWHEYVADVSTLEQVAAAAAQAGDLEQALLAWDAFSAMGHVCPTDSLYESVAQVFATNPLEQIGSAFTVLAEMEERGYHVSRALIRSLSLHLRYVPPPSVRAQQAFLANLTFPCANVVGLWIHWLVSEKASYLDPALHQLKELHRGGLHVTTALLNVILSASAERGDLERTHLLLEEFGHFGTPLDADSYSFAMEACGKHLARRTRTVARPALVEQCLDAAVSLLTRMEEQGIAPTHHVIREYVELLCFAGQTETATQVILEAAECDLRLVSNKAVHRVGMANVKRGNYQVARQVANLASEPQLYLLRSIEQGELSKPLADI